MEKVCLTDSSKKIIKYNIKKMITTNDDVSVDDIITVSNDLKYTYYYDSYSRRLRNMQLEFFNELLSENSKFYNQPYNKATEEFVESDYLSSEIKERLYIFLEQEKNVPQDVLDLLSSDKNIRDFSIDEIKELSSIMERFIQERPINERNYLCNSYLNLLKDYLFEINSDVGIRYTIEDFDGYMPLSIMHRSFISTEKGPVDGRKLGEKHLFSLYKYICKFYPDKADEYINMVNKIRRITPLAFRLNYWKFVDNDFNSHYSFGFNNEDFRNIYGYDSQEEASKHIITENDLLLELEENARIKEEFNRLVNEYKEQLNHGVQKR